MAQTKNIQLILREILEKVEPPKQDLEKINKYLKQFKEKIEKQIKRQKFDAVLFEGGSFAKKQSLKKIIMM